jgi:DNA-binding response OmpR family regulator
MEYHRILLVEDELRLRQVIARNLTARGHVVAEATTASDAVAAIRAERPDLLLLDLNLPDQSGWDVLRALRRQRIEVPTVVVSAVRVVPGRLAEFQPLAYLPKPFPLEALLRLFAADPDAEPSDDRRSRVAEGTGPPSDEPAPVAKEEDSYA